MVCSTYYTYERIMVEFAKRGSFVDGGAKLARTTAGVPSKRSRSKKRIEPEAGAFCNVPRQVTESREARAIMGRAAGVTF